MKGRFFKEAKKASKNSDFRKTNLGCVVVYKNKVVSVGYNSQKTHPVQKKYNVFRGIPSNNLGKVHAETKALSMLLEADLDWNNVTVYTYREHKDGSLAMARPCNSCMQLMKNLGIRKICYSTDMGFAKEVITESTLGKWGKFKTA